MFDGSTSSTTTDDIELENNDPTTEAANQKTPFALPLVVFAGLVLGSRPATWSNGVGWWVLSDPGMYVVVSIVT